MAFMFDKELVLSILAQIESCTDIGCKKIRYEQDGGACRTETACAFLPKLSRIV